MMMFIDGAPGQLKNYLLILALAVFSISTARSAKDTLSTEEVSEWARKWDRFTYVPKSGANKPILSASAGPAYITPGRASSEPGLATALSTRFEYGFFRFVKQDKTPETDYFSGETISVDLISSNMLPGAIKENGLKCDNWRFGMGYRNGFSLNPFTGTVITFYHMSDIAWSHFDTEILSVPAVDTLEYQKFDKKIKFGSGFASGVMIGLTNTVNIGAEYSSQFVYPETEAGKWIGSSFSELLMQRAVDFLAYDYVDKHPHSGPLSVLAVKTFISGIYAFGKRSSGFFPFGGDRPMSFSVVRLKMTFVF